MGIFSAVSEIAGKFNILSHGGVEKSCRAVGHELVQVAKANEGKLTIDQVRSAYGQVLPKRSKLQVSSDINEAAAFISDAETKASVLRGDAAAFVARNVKGEKLLYLPIGKDSTVKVVNTATHELEHVLNHEMTLFSKAETLLSRMGIQVEHESMKTRELIRDLIHKMGLFNPVEGQTQKGLLEYLRVKTRKEMEGKLAESVRKVLKPQSEKANIRCLRALRRNLADESRAYRVGGKTAREYLELQDGRTTSEVASELLGETTGVIAKEIRAQRIKRLKRRFGLNVQDYEGVPKPKVSDPVLAPRTTEELEKELAKHPDQANWLVI